MRIFKLLFLLAFIIGIFWVVKWSTETALPEKQAPVTLYANQDRDDLEKVYVNAISKAQKSIVLLIYNLSDPAIIYNLNKKAEQGIDVTIVCDAEASRNIKKRLNIAVKVYPQEGKGLMHLKLLVVDEDLVLAGSANLSKYSLRIHGNLVMGFYSAELAHFVKERSQNIIAGQEGDTVAEKEFILGQQKVEFWFLPNDPKAVQRLIQLIDNAKKSIRIAMFTWTRKDLAQAVIRSRLKGVKVEVVLDNNASKGSSKKIAKLLLHEKIQVAANTDGGLLHHKFMVVDSHTLVNGSANWTKAAFTLNQDCFMIIDQLNRQQQQKMDKLWESIKADAKAYNGR